MIHLLCLAVGALIGYFAGYQDGVKDGLEARKWGRFFDWGAR